MAPYFFDPNLEDEQQQAQNQDPTSVAISGAAPTYNTQGNPNQAQSNNQDLNTGSGFQNLDKYLQTNNAKGFGEQFQGKVSDQIGSAQTQMNQASDQFKNQVQSANALPNQGQIDQALANPQSANKEQFKDWRTQAYAGPNNLAEAQDAWNKYYSGINQAQTNTKLLGNEAGRFTLLDQFFGRPSYNFGEKSLDNLLYQESGLGSQAKGLQDQATLLKSQAQDRATNELQNAVSTRVGEVDANRNNVLNSIGINPDGSIKKGQDAGAIGKEQQKVLDELNQANDARHLQQQDLSMSLSQGMFTPEQLQSLGLYDGDKLYNLDLNSDRYLKMSDDLNHNQTITPEERSRIQALSELAGITDTFASGLEQEKSNPYTFDSSLLRSDAMAAGNAYNEKVNQATGQISSILKMIMPVGIALPASNASPEEWYKYASDYLKLYDSSNNPNSGGSPFLVLRDAVSQYEKAQSTYTPNRTVNNPIIAYKDPVRRGPGSGLIL